MKQIKIQDIKQIIKDNFVYATLNFIFIIAFVNVFQMIFGIENSIVGVIFTIMMASSMMRDLTATPIKHLFIQAFVLVMLAVNACLVVVLPPFFSFFINFITIFGILYFFTYEYASHLYFPYILSYLFLIFISPITISQLPKRMIGMLVGAVCIILYQLFMGRKRVGETAKDVITIIIDNIIESIECLLLNGEKKSIDLTEIRHNLCRLSRIIYERRKKVLCISDASFSMLDTARGLEHIAILVHNLEGAITQERKIFLEQILKQLENYRAYIQGETDVLSSIERKDFISEQYKKEADDFYWALVYVKYHLTHITDSKKRISYQKTMLSFSVRLKLALHVSQVRIVYALRVAFLLAVCTLIVQFFHLPHGKWLLFTIASVSLPYADDIGLKAKKRITATIIGGIISVVAYSLIPSSVGRMTIMMLSGYLSFYFKDYASNFSCSTIGALGGAVFMGIFGWNDVGMISLIRLCYIGIGIGIAFIGNLFIFPFWRKTATNQLLQKYSSTVDILTKMCKEENIDSQLYYNLVIQAHLQEDKLYQNAEVEGWKEMEHILIQYRQKIREVHRKYAPTPMGSIVLIQE